MKVLVCQALFVEEATLAQAPLSAIRGAVVVAASVLGHVTTLEICLTHAEAVVSAVN